MKYYTEFKIWEDKEERKQKHGSMQVHENM